jgi:hypothetical protein
MDQSEGKMKSGAIETTVAETTEPVLGEPRCPNGHNSAIPPRCPALMFVTCWHYSTEATWNEYCITCGVHHAPFKVYWHFYRMDDQSSRPKEPLRILRGEDGQWQGRAFGVIVSYFSPSAH